ncbi:unnamed protein product [Adineta ricciae]|uniref:Uncharacterized protein n=1 Tax=Adineta ricciae TaxID=249248 RepID=A0A815DL10_ADIRI|nr:unnamed protein product [Adineta ricciae]
MKLVRSHTIATVLSLQTLSTCIIFTLGQYIYTFYLQIYTPLLHSTFRNVTAITTSTSLNKHHSLGKCAKVGRAQDDVAQAWAQQRSADLFFWINVWSCFPIIIMTYILGLYTPKLGRRFVLILPMIGIAIQVTIWLAIIYFHLPEHWWYIAAFIVGLSGSDNVRNFVLNLFITENTIETERSSRFVIFGAISMVVSAIGTFVIGYYIAWRGFTNLYWIALFLQLISIFIVLFFFKSDIHHSRYLTNSDQSDSFLQSARQPTNCQFYFHICQILTRRNRSRKKYFSLLLTLLVYALFSFLCTAFSVLLLYLLNAPFCWTSKHVGNFSATALIIFGIFSVAGMKLLTKFGACDIVICIISHIFLCLTLLWFAFAENDLQMYIGLLFSSLSGYPNFLTLSMVSKWLESHERTSAFTLTTEINTIMKVTGYCFFNWIYARTVMHYKNFTFLLAAGLTIIPLLLNICLWYISRTMSDEPTDPVEEIDLKPGILSVPTEWSAPIVNANSFIISQQLSDLSRTNSMSSSEDYNVRTL